MVIFGVFRRQYGATRQFHEMKWSIHCTAMTSKRSCGDWFCINPVRLLWIRQIGTGIYTCLSYVLSNIKLVQVSDKILQSSNLKSLTTNSSRESSLKSTFKLFAWSYVNNITEGIREQLPNIFIAFSNLFPN